VKRVCVCVSVCVWVLV